MADFSIEEQLRHLQKNKDDTYTLSGNLYTVLLERYSKMKRDIIECVKIKKECEILKQDKEHIQSQYFKINELENELFRVQQENGKLTKISQDTLKLAERAVQELQSVRAKNAI